MIVFYVLAILFVFYIELYAVMRVSWFLLGKKQNKVLGVLIFIVSAVLSALSLNVFPIIGICLIIDIIAKIKDYIQR